MDNDIAFHDKFICNRCEYGNIFFCKYTIEVTIHWVIGTKLTYIKIVDCIQDTIFVNFFIHIVVLCVKYYIAIHVNKHDSWMVKFGYCMKFKLYELQFVIAEVVRGKFGSYWYCLPVHVFSLFWIYTIVIYFVWYDSYTYKTYNCNGNIYENIFG